MNRSNGRINKAMVFAVAFALLGTEATACSDREREAREESTRQQLLALWAEMPHPAPACVDDSASIPLLTDGTVQSFTTGPRETVFHFATGANGAQVTVTNVGPCNLDSSYHYCDPEGYLRGDQAGISCSPVPSTISGAGASRTCTLTRSSVRIVPWYGGSPQGCSYNVRIATL